MQLYRWFVYILLLSVFLGSCQKEEESDNSRQIREVKKMVQETMNIWYLWKDQMPAVQLSAYSTPEELLDALRNPSDRWSYLTGRNDFNAYYQSGSYVGHGFSYMPDEEGNVRITFVYKDSPLWLNGVRRGWKLVSINGTIVNSGMNISSLFGPALIGYSNRLVLEDLDGITKTITTEKKQISMNTVLDRKILRAGNKKVAYLAFESFVQTSILELNSAFTFFKDSTYDEMVIDLRYNGGGNMNVAIHLAGLIASGFAAGQPLVKIQHNATMSYRDTLLSIPQNMNEKMLQRIFFISGRGTASASEVVINGLEPYLEVKLVGDSTYGKPVGMYTFDFSPYDAMFVPVCFQLRNAQDVGEYFNGIPADYYSNDDLLHELGSVDEAILKSVLFYIETGSFPPRRKKSSFTQDFIKREIQGNYLEHFVL